MNDFFAMIYEAGDLFYMNEFSNDLYNYSLYIPVGLTLIISSIIGLVLYYYVIDNPRFAKWWHWLFWVLIFCVINFAVGYYLTYTELDIKYAEMEMQLPYSSEFLTFSLENALYTFFFCFGASFLIKGIGSLVGLSVMTRKTPF